MTTSVSTVRCEALVIGVSMGGVELLLRLIPELPADYLPTIVCIHAPAGTTQGLADLLAKRSRLRVKEAEDKEAPSSGCVHLAPGGYHLLLERERIFGLSVDPPVAYSRPSIDVLFESAAEAYGPTLCGLLLTGANSDGAQGLATIKRRGGRVAIQNPDEAEAPEMPRAGMAAVDADWILPTAGILPWMLTLFDS
jgi:two-component system chemotaxis response regulator CheB